MTGSAMAAPSNTWLQPTAQDLLATLAASWVPSLRSAAAEPQRSPFAALRENAALSGSCLPSAPLRENQALETDPPSGDRSAPR